MIGANPLALFAELVILPEQTMPRPPTRPELRLMLEVLRIVLLDLQTRPTAVLAARHANVLRQDAINYVTQHDERYEFSFARICGNLGINEEAARKALLSVVRPVSVPVLGKPRWHPVRVGAKHHPGKRR